MGKTRKASAEARKQQITASNISYEATLEWLKALKANPDLAKSIPEELVFEENAGEDLEKLECWKEILDENGEIKSQWLGILGENYKNTKKKVNQRKKEIKKLVEKLEKQKVKIERLDSKLGNLKLYEERLDEVPENLMAIYQNQLYDLAKPDISLEHLASELTFYDFLMRIASGEPVNIHYIPFRNAENAVKVLEEYFSVDETPVKDGEKQSPMRKSRLFKRVLSSETTPNEKNFEKNLIEKLNNSRILEEMELLDGLQLAELRENLDSIEYLADQYREFIVENGLSVKEQKEIIKKYQKERKKITDRTLKIKYNLRQKYGYTWKMPKCSGKNGVITWENPNEKLEKLATN